MYMYLVFPSRRYPRPVRIGCNAVKITWKVPTTRIISYYLTFASGQRSFSFSFHVSTFTDPE